MTWILLYWLIHESGEARLVPKQDQQAPDASWPPVSREGLAPGTGESALCINYMGEAVRCDSHQSQWVLKLPPIKEPEK